MKENEKLKEMMEKALDDPHLLDGVDSADLEKFYTAMTDLTGKIVRPIHQYAMEHGDDDKGWVNTVLISLARATCNIIFAMQHTVVADGRDLFGFYSESLLPVARGISEAEGAMALKDLRSGSGVERMKKGVIMAIADPRRSEESIIAEFFKKDLSEEERSKIEEHIKYMRSKYSDRLDMVNEYKRNIN